MAAIYRITHPSGMTYIGCAANPPARKRSHRCDLNKGRHKCKPLQALWPFELEFEIIEELPPDADTKYKRERELAAMDQYAEQGLLLNKHRISYEMPAEVREKAIRNARKANLGRPLGDEQKMKMSESQKKSWTDERKAANGEMTKKRWADPAWRAFMLERRRLAAESKKA